MRRATGLRVTLRVVALALLAIAAVPAARAVESVDVAARNDAGFGRLVLTFEGRASLPAYTVSSANGVLVLSFEEAVAAAVDRVPAAVPAYVSAARLDPDGGGLRFALAPGVTVQATPAGGALYVDLLSPGWTGPPPALPPEVAAALARAAAEADRLAREAALLAASDEVAPALDVGVATLPSFTRLVFSWNVPFTARFERADREARIVFNRTAVVDLGPLRAALPPYIADVRAETDEGGRTVVILAVAPEMDLRAFRDEDGYVVDVSPPAAPDGGEIAGLHEAIDEIPAGVAREVVESFGAGLPAETPHPVPGEGQASAHDPDLVVGPERSTAPEPLANPEDLSGRAPESIGGQPRLDARREGEAIRIDFSFDRPTPAAVFLRGDALWLVFDHDTPLDAVRLQDALGDLARAVLPVPLDAAQAVRIDLVRPVLAAMVPVDGGWTLVLRETLAEPGRPLLLERSILADGARALEVDLEVGAVHALEDPFAGDRILVVTAPPPARGLLTPQRFAEVDALGSMQGLAFVARTDDLTVLAHESGVVVRRDGGLSLSTPVGGPAAAGTRPGSGPRSPGFLDFSELAAPDPASFAVLRASLNGELARADTPPARRSARYRMARFLVSSELGPEARGVLDLLAESDPAEVARPSYQLLMGAADVLSGRMEEAREVLGVSALVDSPDAAVWSLMASVALKEFAAAREVLPRAEAAIDGYPAGLRTRFALAAAEAAVEINDLGSAAALLATVEGVGLGGGDAARRDLLAGRVAAAMERVGEAVRLFTAAVGGEGAAAAEAQFRLVDLQRHTGQITDVQALERLERLAVTWRGDAVELMTLTGIAGLAAADGDYRRGFSALRSAMLVDADADETRRLGESMSAAFASLFLDGEADRLDPVEALALYYDFRELTPVGRRGDEMVRRLADRLIAIDLLAPAAELLQHQVDNRLRGAARAQVAADLALVYLLDERPEQALLALGRTRQAQLPAVVERQRRVVEARALAETGRTDVAVELLQPLEGRDVDQLRADILWNAREWQAAAEAYEQLLGDRWASPLALLPEDELACLRAGIAYVLAGDALGRDRLRSKFLDHMTEGEYAAAFIAVTGPDGAAGAAFNEAAETVARIDTMDAFLAAYRRQYLAAGADALPDAPAG